MTKRIARIAQVDMTDLDGNVVHLEGLNKLTKDLKAASGSMSREEAGELVTMYYMVQLDRQRLSSQLRELEKREKPHQVAEFFRDQFLLQEQGIKTALDVYSQNTIMGKWAREIIGIGPVLASGLDANINLQNCRTAGDLWSYSGLNPMSKWVGRKGAQKIVTDLKQKFEVGNVKTLAKNTEAFEAFVRECAKEIGLVANPPAGAVGKLDGGRRLILRMDETFTELSLVKAMAKRPWNARLKTLCWKIGESFKNFSGNEDSLYGRIYLDRKAYEWDKNLNGDYSDQARARAREVGKDTTAYKWYTGCYNPEQARKALVAGVALSTLEPEGHMGQFIELLSPGHIMERSKRYAVKLFLSHYHHVGWVRVLGKEPPFPYAQAMLNHAHVIGPEKAA